MARNQDGIWPSTLTLTESKKNNSNLSLFDANILWADTVQVDPTYSNCN